MTEETNVQQDLETAKTVAEARLQQTPGEAEAAQDKKDNPDVEYVPCPCCGKLTLIRPIDVKGDLLDQYMACIMSGVPFWHKYKLYGGKLAVTVTQLSADDARRLSTGLASIERLQKYLNAEHKEMSNEVIRRIKLFCGISGIETEKRAYTPNNTVYQAIDLLKSLPDDIEFMSKGEHAAREGIETAYNMLRSPDTVSAVPDRVLLLVLDSQAQLYNLLLGAGFDKTFWEGIELA